MDYHEALRYIDSFTDYEKKTGYDYSAESFDLRRPRALLSELDDPQLTFPSILVAGTKGKGSTAAMVASILQASGRRAGLYSQPHLHSFRERMRVDGQPISRTEIAAAVAAVVPAVERLLRSHSELGVPTSYEVATAAAMLFFAARKPDLVVLEVGLGGRLDAVNVVDPVLSVLTPISLDHVQILGNTIAEIAQEKAGIIKENGLVVCAEQREEAMAVIRRVAAERGARLLVAKPEIVDGTHQANAASEPLPETGTAHPRVERTRPTLRGPSGTPYRVDLPLLGAHQVANAATAIAAVEQLPHAGSAGVSPARGPAQSARSGTALARPPITRDAVERGLATVRWPGRLEVVSRQPLVLVDGAHNGDSASKLAVALGECFAYRRLILILGTSADKDVEGIAAALVPSASAVVATRSRHPRAADPGRIAAACDRWCSTVRAAPDISAALTLATSLATPADLICVTGSLFAVADAREHYGLAEDVD